MELNHKIFIFIFVVNYYVKAIPCKFQFEGEEAYLEHERFDLDMGYRANSYRRDSNDYNCEDGYPTTKNYYRTSHGDGSSLGETNEYEEMESSCQVRRRTIVPKALNNIYNKLTKVLNNETFVQSINTEECINTKENCNSYVVTPYDKKYICRQKFVLITLKALNEENSIVDEQFFYPSHCVCELVTVKRIKRRLKKKQRCFDVE